MPVVTSKAKVTSQINFTELSFCQNTPFFLAIFRGKDTRAMEISDPSEVKEIQNNTKTEQYTSI